MKLPLQVTRKLGKLKDELLCPKCKVVTLVSEINGYRTLNIRTECPSCGGKVDCMAEWIGGKNKRIELRPQWTGGPIFSGGLAKDLALNG